jgi:hypothetical protein
MTEEIRSSCYLEPAERCRRDIACLTAEYRKQSRTLATLDKQQNETRLSMANTIGKLRYIVEKSGEDWWPWYAANGLEKVRSRKDAEKLLAMSEAGEPEKALEIERTRTRAQVARHRSAKPSRIQSDVSGKTSPEGNTCSNTDGKVSYALVERQFENQFWIDLEKIEPSRRLSFLEGLCAKLRNRDAREESKELA